MKLLTKVKKTTTRSGAAGGLLFSIQGCLNTRDELTHLRYAYFDDRLRYNKGILYLTEDNSPIAVRSCDCPELIHHDSYGDDETGVTTDNFILFLPGESKDLDDIDFDAEGQTLPYLAGTLAAAYWKPALGPVVVELEGNTIKVYGNLPSQEDYEDLCRETARLA